MIREIFSLTWAKFDNIIALRRLTQSNKSQDFLPLY